MTIGALAAGICATSAGMHGLSIALAARRCRRRSGASMPPPKDAPSVTIVQPLCGVETFSRETLRSIFALDYPSYEIVFCLASGDNPIARLVRGASAARLGNYRLFECVEAGRLHPALPRALASRYRHCLRPADRLSSRELRRR